MKKTKNKKHKINFNLVLITAFFTAIVLVYSTYAWFSSSVDVTISNFKVYADTKNGLYISLDGVTWSDEIDISKYNLLTLLKETYNNHTTQWSDALTTVSSVGISNNNQDKFNFYYSPNGFYRVVSYNNDDSFDFSLYESENTVNEDAPFMAFDLFLKNITPSPYSDNVYLDKTFEIIKKEDSHDDYSYLYAIRVGFVFYDEIDVDSSVYNIQNSKCNYNCSSVIFDPYSNKHDTTTIKEMQKHGYTIYDNTYYPTYALYKAGEGIKVWEGVYGSVNNDYFKLQNCSTSINDVLTTMGNSIRKVRVYIWIEGQDIDILEKQSIGDNLNIKLNFIKDLAGYYQ